MITVIKTANYSLTFNNGILVSAKCLTSGRFVKRSIAATEYQAQQQQLQQLASKVTNSAVRQASNKAIINAVKILSAASFKVTAIVFFALFFIALTVSFFIATPAVLIGKIVACSLVSLMPVSLVALLCKDVIDDAKNNLRELLHYDLTKCFYSSIRILHRIIQCSL